MNLENNSPPIVAFFNNKGGVGKTTLVYHLAYMFGELGKKALTVDLDPQSNLTAMFLNEKIENFWTTQSNKTILNGVKPLIKGVGDIAEVHLEKITPNISLMVGDLRLSQFEDKLSDAWIKCSDGDEAAFRIVSAFFRIIRKAAQTHKSDIVLIDVGPNLGAINRSALIASDFVITPVAPDLFSVQGLRNLGPTLIRWRQLWETKSKSNPEATLILPKGKMKPIGYIVLQHGVRGNRPVQAYLKWANRIPETYSISVLDSKNNSFPQSSENDEHCLGLLKHYQSLMPMSMEARKPIFLLKPADGAIGAHYQAVQRCYRDFEILAKKMLESIPT